MYVTNTLLGMNLSCQDLQSTDAKKSTTISEINDIVHGLTMQMKDQKLLFDAKNKALFLTIEK